LPIFRSTRLCVTACGIMHPRCCRPLAGNIVGVRVWTNIKFPGQTTVRFFCCILYVKQLGRNFFRVCVTIVVYCSFFLLKLPYSKSILKQAVSLPSTRHQKLHKKETVVSVSKVKINLSLCKS